MLFRFAHCPSSPPCLLGIPQPGECETSDHDDDEDTDDDDDEDTVKPCF